MCGFFGLEEETVVNFFGLDGETVLNLRTKDIKSGKNNKYSAAKMKGAATNQPNSCVV